MESLWLKFKNTRTVSSNEVDFLSRIPVMLCQQQYWKFASVRRNIGTSWFRKLGCKMQHLANLETHKHCLKLPTCYCTSESTILIDMPDHQVIITAVTVGYTSFLSVPISISLTYPFVVCSVTEHRGIWNSFTTVPNLTNLIVTTDRRLLAIIVWRRTLWIK
jgi:hypothetical protein